jgi:hypothetical protein
MQVLARVDTRCTDADEVVRTARVPVPHPSPRGTPSYDRGRLKREWYLVPARRDALLPRKEVRDPSESNPHLPRLTPFLRRALLKSSPKYTLVRSVAAVVLNKADILPTWPAYAPLLPHPTTYDLPWARESGPTTGEKKYSKATIKVGGSDGNAGDVWIEGIREASAFGPGDEVEMSVQIGWEGDRPIRVSRIHQSSISMELY